jgi:hypothetical protein
MRLFRCLLLIASFLFVAGCDDPEPCHCPGGRCPVNRSEPQDFAPRMAATWADIPIELRQANYSGGSCTWASMETMFRWHGLDAEAELWRKTYSGGANWGDVARECDRRGIRFAFTERADEQFLEWCARTRRPAMIHWGAAHSINFCGYDGQAAVLIDNNLPQHELLMPKQEFLARWRASFGNGVALAIVEPPPPPEPTVMETSH